MFHIKLVDNNEVRILC